MNPVDKPLCLTVGTFAGIVGALGTITSLLPPSGILGAAIATTTILSLTLTFNVITILALMITGVGVILLALAIASPNKESQDSQETQPISNTSLKETQEDAPDPIDQLLNDIGIDSYENLPIWNYGNDFDHAFNKANHPTCTNPNILPQNTIMRVDSAQKGFVIRLNSSISQEFLSDWEKNYSAFKNYFSVEQPIQNVIFFYLDHKNQPELHRSGMIEPFFRKTFHLPEPTWIYYPNIIRQLVRENGYLDEQGLRWQLADDT